MKRLIVLILALLLCVASAEDKPFGPYDITAPEGVTLKDNEGSFTFVQGETRVVAMVIARVPEENSQDALIRLMGQFEAEAVIGEDAVLAEGFHGLYAVTQDRFGEGVDQVTCMILSDGGQLLILSGYDMNGDEDRVHALLDALLAAVTAEGKPILPAQE